MKWIGLLLQMAAVCVAVGVAMALPRRARLVLTDDRLSYHAGLPLMARWLDWTLDLNAVRQGAVGLQWAGAPMGRHPEALYRLTWGAGGLRGVRPAAWHVPGQPEPPRQPPHAILGLVSWQRPDNQPILRRNLDALPLVQALRARGVAVPSITGRRQLAGIDLMAYARIRSAVWAFFGLLAIAVVLFHGLRHQHFFAPPSGAALIGLGLAAALAALAWMAPERERAAERLASRHEFWIAKLLIALLLGVALALCAPLLALGWGVLAKPERTVVWVVQVADKPRLRAVDDADVPPLAPRQAREFWASLHTGEHVTLPVRRGTAGWWWQYDSAALAERVEAFYAKRPPRPPARAGS